MNFPRIIAKVRFKYHCEMLDIVNSANQLHILKDEKAEEANKKHTMTIINDILPRLYGEKVVEMLIKDSLKDEAI